MRIYDIIAKKRDGEELSAKEIKFVVDSYTKDKVEDYHIAAFLMAVYINGMTDHEISVLTECMINSGEKIDLSLIPGIKVDKHSTGGVGDKTTLIVSPIVAACGVPVAKMSGRGLGYTGGTIDKLESIPGMRTALKKEEFFEIIQKVGFSIASQSKDLAPADKKFYALRDVTSTVDSIPLIASSVMSKKLALGSDCILLDVKCGNGAFMKDFDSAVKLAKTMVSIGKSSGKETVAIITDMNNPLGYSIGNWVEVAEACDILKGKGHDELKKISIYLAANMLYLAGKGSISKCKELSCEAIENGLAFKKFKEMVFAQGGDTSVLDDPNKYPTAQFSYTVFSDKEGYINAIDADKCGKVSVLLGAGREKKEADIDYCAGIVLLCKVGDHINIGNPVAILYSKDMKNCLKGEGILLDALQINSAFSLHSPLVQARITNDGVERFI